MQITGPMNENEASKKGEPKATPPPPYNDKLDPDNATSPLDIEEREREGEKKFYPEGGPEDPPVYHKKR